MNKLVPATLLLWALEKFRVYDYDYDFHIWNPRVFLEKHTLENDATIGLLLYSINR